MLRTRPGSDPEFIYQANNLEKIILRIGQKLEIPQVDFSIEAHLASKKLVLLEHGNFFKSYPLMDARPLSRKTSELHSKVQEKIAFRDGRRVIFGSREYGGSLRLADARGPARLHHLWAVRWQPRNGTREAAGQRVGAGPVRRRGVAFAGRRRHPGHHLREVIAARR